MIRRLSILKLQRARREDGGGDAWIFGSTGTFKNTAASILMQSLARRLALLFLHEKYTKLEEISETSLTAKVWSKVLKL